MTPRRTIGPWIPSASHARLALTAVLVVAGLLTPAAAAAATDTDRDGLPNTGSGRTR